MANRIIGKYKGSAPGPLLVITAAMHGNEPAGVQALDLLFKMLEVEPITNPEFVYRGEIIGIIGNLEAYSQGKRFIEKDINRCWFPDQIRLLKAQAKNELLHEDSEIIDILNVIEKEIEATKTEKLYLLDLHTTSADGIFCIATNDSESINIAHDIHAPVILGLLHGIEGTTLHYFNQENLGIATSSIAFEAGNHNDPLSINRCIAATINFMRTIGVIEPNQVPNIHDELLKKYSDGLPEIVEVFYRYNVKNNDLWKMKPGFKNFHKIHQGELLAHDDGKEVLAPFDGYLLMPLYQNQGRDGFFIAKKLK